MLARGEVAPALAFCEHLEGSAREDVNARQFHAEVLLAAGRLPEAICELDRCLAEEADRVDAILLRAATRHSLGQVDAALDDYRRVLALQPYHADALHNIGRLLVRKGEFEAALASYDAAIAARPEFPDAINNRGVVLKQLGRNEEALQAFRLALALAPTHLEALRNYPELLFASTRDPGVLELYDQALATYPDDAILHNNRGTVLQAMGRYGEALACFQRALELAPDYPDALNNSGTVLQVFDRYAEAETCIRKAIEFEPGKVSAHWNLGLALLRMGRFEEGWHEHEWRWRKAEFQRHVFGFKQPRWDGSQSLEGKTILLTTEQGYGDSIQFVRYALRLHRHGARVLLLVPRALVELFAGSLPVAGVFNATTDLPPFDFHAPLLSLPLAFGTTLESIPAETPYLAPPPSRSIVWKQSLPRRVAPRVGLVWAGRSSHANDRHRSLSLSQMEPLLRVTGCEFVALQNEIAADDRRYMDAHPDISVLGDRFEDFSDTAAVISMLDLVITVDTAVAHLAGAMGKPVWILIPPAADWRWLHGRTDSPWYPTARLYRRSHDEEWDSVIREVARDLASFSATAVSPAPPALVTGPADALKAAAMLHNNGRLDDAIAIYRGVLQIEPGNFDANHLLGIARRSQGRFAEAEELIHRALRVRPDNLPALKSLARVQLSLCKHELALETSARITAREPDAAEPWADRGVSLIALERYDDALASLDRALELKPGHINALNNRGVVLLHLGRHAEALASLDRALEIQPGYADAIGNRGLALLGLGRTSEAVENYRDGLKLHPGSTTMLSNLGISLMALNRHTEAIECFHQTLAIDPNHVDANWNLSLSLLASGDYRNGWRQYEWRWKRVEMAPHFRSFHVPLWTGEQNLAGRTLLLHFEQGFGDTIQFLRYVRPLSSAGARIVLALPEALRRLAQASFPGVGVFCGNEVLPPFDLHCPLLGLPLACGTSLDSIPAADPPYLRPPAESLLAWKERLGRRKKAIRVGLVWSGNPAHKHDSSRSLEVDLLRPLLDLPGTEFYGLQKDVREDDARQLGSMKNLRMIGGQFADFGDTAAAISQLDLVISVDTSVAHLAGALGKPVWIILPFAADWRWLTDREDSVWYPTARLFRHPDEHSVRETLRRIAAALPGFHRKPGK